MPKSASFTCPSPPIRMLPGLMSRCTMPALVDVAEDGGELGPDRREVVAGDRPGLAVLGQAAALDELEHQERLVVLGDAGVEHGDEERVVEGGQQLHLVGEPGPVGLGGGVHPQQLHGDLALQHGVLGAVDVGHPAAPEQLRQLVAVGQHPAGSGRAGSRTGGGVEHGDAVLSRRDPGTVFYPKPAGTIAVGGKKPRRTLAGRTSRVQLSVTRGNEPEAWLGQPGVFDADAPGGTT